MKTSRSGSTQSATTKRDHHPGRLLFRPGRYLCCDHLNRLTPALRGGTDAGLAGLKVPVPTQQDGSNENSQCNRLAGLQSSDAPPAHRGRKAQGEMIDDEGLPADRPLVAKSPRWTHEEDDLLRRLAEEGLSIALIAERLKRTQWAARKRATRIGITSK
jgi:hypothetical protein